MTEQISPEAVDQLAASLSAEVRPWRWDNPLPQYERERENWRQEARELLADIYPEIERQVREQVAAEIRSVRESIPGRRDNRWVDGYRGGLHDAANIIARGQEANGG